jgi:hypothetical protein
MVIGNFDGASSPRPAQGPKSSAFHFSARMCAVCNNTRTQAPDREFDRLHALVSALLIEGKAPELVFNSPQYEIGSERYLNVFRYFAKILCCHVAESCGPRPLAVSEFALGKVDQNPVFLHIDSDPTYADYLNRFGEHQYAAHGGLVVPTNAETELPTSFRSSLSLGAARYIFWVEFGADLGGELKTFHPVFWNKCEVAYREALKKPLPDGERRRQGI